MTLAVVDRTVVDGDPQPWRAAWAQISGRASLIALVGDGDDEGSRLLRDQAVATLPAPVDLCALRQALLRALK